MDRRSLLKFLGAVAVAPVAIVETLAGRGLAADFDTTKLRVHVIERYRTGYQLKRIGGYGQLNAASVEDMLIDIRAHCIEDNVPLSIKPTHFLVRLSLTDQQQRHYDRLLNDAMTPLLNSCFPPGERAKQLHHAALYGDGVALTSCAHPVPWWSRLKDMLMPRRADDDAR